MLAFLKNILEIIKYFLIKSGKALLLFARLILLSRFRYRKYGKAEPGRQAIVVGNGPSFRKQLEENKNFYAGKDVICVNNFPATEEYKMLRPSACVWLDPFYYNTKEKTGLRKDIQEMLDVLVKETQWEITIYIPHFASHRVYYKELNKLNSNITVVFFNYTIADTFDSINHFLYKTRWASPRATTVVIAALYIAITKRYQKIYLAGSETDFIKRIIVDKNNELFYEQEHFYTKEKNLSKIKTPTAGFGELTLGKYLSFIANIYKGYTEIESYAKHMRVKIINITPGSYIDAFEKKDIPEL